jgi:hypothetical protein
LAVKNSENVDVLFWGNDETECIYKSDADGSKSQVFACNIKAKEIKMDLNKNIYFIDERKS